MKKPLKWWTATSFDVGRELGNPAYVYWCDERIKEVTSLLSRLDETLQCTHLDMRSEHIYQLTPRSCPIISEIKAWLAGNKEV